MKVVMQECHRHTSNIRQHSVAVRHGKSIPAELFACFAVLLCAASFASGQSPGVTQGHNLAFGGIVEIELGGTTPGSGPGNHDQINDSGTLQLIEGPTLSILSYSNFVPAPGDEFTILTWQHALEGTFGPVEVGPLLAAEVITFDLDYDNPSGAGDLTITARYLCDLDTDAACDLDDINLLLAVGDLTNGVGVTAGVNDKLDLTGDAIIDGADLDAWLVAAGSVNGFLGPYLHGDADLNGIVDFLDFNLWAIHRFQNESQWNRGDFNGSGVVDFLDFNIWAGNRFQSTPMLVPEPAWLLVCGLSMVWCACRSD